MPCVLLTRAQEDLPIARARLMDAGWEVITNPLLIYEPLPFIFSGPLPRAWLATSRNAVTALTHLDPERARPVFCVGEATSAKAQALGFETHTASGDGESLLTLICARLFPQDGPLIHVSGEHLRVDLEARLRPMGYDVTRLQVYTARGMPHMTPALEAALVEGRLTHALFYSRRTAQIFHDMMRTHPQLSLQRVCAIAMGPSIVELLQDQSWQDVRLAKDPLQALLSMGRNTCK